MAMIGVMTRSARCLLAIALAVGSALLTQRATACTGISLTAQDGAVVYGRTLEWGAFDLESRLMIVGRGAQLRSRLDGGRTGKQWQGRYGVVGIDAVEKPLIVDGLNERGLAVGVFYLPGFAQFQSLDVDNTQNSIGPLDLANYLLTQFATVDGARAALDDVRVVPVVEPKLGFSPPVHFLITDPSGKAIVVQYVKGGRFIHDNPLGVITNSPTYDWHTTNLRNYINLSPVALPGKRIGQLDFTPLGAGSGMIGLPGDFTPPSRFVRAVAFTQTARTTADGPETIYELFRILDNFNVPLSAAEGSELKGDKTGMRSSTVWTSGADTRNLMFYYHTQHNRRMRAVDIKAIDFDAIAGGIRHLPLDIKKVQDIERIKVD